MKNLPEFKKIRVIKNGREGTIIDKQWREDYKDYLYIIEYEDAKPESENLNDWIDNFRGDELELIKDE